MFAISLSTGRDVSAVRLRSHLAAHPLNGVDQLLESIAEPVPEVDELPSALNEHSVAGCSGHGDAATAAEIEEAFVT